MSTTRTVSHHCLYFTIYKLFSAVAAMADANHLVVAILKFLDNERSSSTLSKESKESIQGGCLLYSLGIVNMLILSRHSDNT